MTNSLIILNDYFCIIVDLTQLFGDFYLPPGVAVFIILSGTTDQGTA